MHYAHLLCASNILCLKFARMTSCWLFEDKTQIDLLITSNVVNSLRNGLETCGDFCHVILSGVTRDRILTEETYLAKHMINAMCHGCYKGTDISVIA